MPFLKSQKSWIYSLCVVLAVLVPVALSLRGAWSLSQRVLAQQASENDRIKILEIRAQSHALSDFIWAQLEIVQAKALTIDGLEKFQGDSSIADVLEVGNGNGNGNRTANSATGYAIQKRLPNPISTVHFTNIELESAVRLISPQEVQKSGLSLFPVTSGNFRFLGIAFQNPSPSKVVTSQMLVAVVDPQVAFGGIQSWASGKDGEILRGYIVGRDGRTIIHTDKIYSGSDISNHPLFKQALLPTIRGERVGGTGIYAAIDTLSSRVSYQQFRSLPYAVVAERVVRSNNTAWTSSFLKTLLGPAAVFALVLLLSMAGSIAVLFQLKAQRVESEDVNFGNPEFELEFQKKLYEKASVEFDQSELTGALDYPATHDVMDNSEPWMTPYSEQTSEQTSDKTSGRLPS